MNFKTLQVSEWKVNRKQKCDFANKNLRNDLCIYKYGGNLLILCLHNYTLSIEDPFK